MNYPSQKISEKLKKKFDIPFRWLLGAIYLNYYTREFGFEKLNYSIKNYGTFYIGENDIKECNMSTLILICCGIELFGRLLLGHGIKSGIAEESFVNFIHYYFPEEYKKRKTRIYKNYRNSLIHSYVLGYESRYGFFPTRNNREHGNNHLTFLPRTRRLIINIDLFIKDFQEAVDRYWEDIRSGSELKFRARGKIKKINVVKNALESLKHF